jgi:hypothetical protein
VIGCSAVASHAILLTILGFLAFLAFNSWRANRTRCALLRAGVLGLALLLVAIQVACNVVYYLQLRRLSAEAVSSIRVGGREITTAEEVSRVVAALNAAELFAYVHGGTGPKVAMVIHFRSGRTVEWSVAPIQSRKGAVVDFNRPGAYGLRRGSVFSAQLIGALHESRAPRRTTD